MLTTGGHSHPHCPSAPPLGASPAPPTPCANRPEVGGALAESNEASPCRPSSPDWPNQGPSEPATQAPPSDFLRELGPQGTYILHKKVGLGLRLPGSVLALPLICVALGDLGT